MIRIAVVEDNDDIRLTLKTLIGGSHGFECNHMFPDGAQALSGLPQLDIDVVLMDINMPYVSGIECVKVLKPQMPHTQFMMYTVYDDDENIFSALQAGATGYILKRSSPVQILDAITELHANGSPMSGEIARRVVDSFNRSFKSTEHDKLTEREKEVLKYLEKGFLYKEIADTLFVSKETVKKHIHNIYEKLHVNSRAKALQKISRQR